MKKHSFLVVLGLLVAFLFSCSSETIVFKIAPTSHNFGQVNIGETATFDFVITNKKSVDMTLTIVSFSTGEFTEISGAQGKTIVTKGNLTITAQFAPAMPGGAKADTMHIEWTDINGKTGKKDVKLSGEAVPVPKINAPTTFDFGTVGIGNTDTHDFDIENTGTADLVLSLFNFNGNATLFSLTAGGTTPVTVIPGATHTVTVQFAPTATGSFPTVFEITHNAVNSTPPAEITISAAGGGGKIEANQTSPWDFSQVAIGGVKTDDVEISNTGSIDLNIQSISLATGTVYSIDSVEDSSGNPVTAPFAITPSDHIVVTIEFQPIAIANYNDSLNIVHDGSYSASPFGIVISGSGRAPITQTFNYTGAVQRWNVPAGVAKIKAECSGAEGGDSQNGGNGGKGGKATASVPVSPGATVNVYVGGRGTTVQSTPTGGWNGGGGTECTYSRYFPGTGGGASDIRIGGTALTDRKVVGGAGGGGGYGSYSPQAGYGGGLTGQDGVGTYSNPNAKGGSQTAGGAGGVWSSRRASAGALGLGGRGRGNSAGGGGGGAGYYGGGGGLLDSGAGGSSYYDAPGNTDKSTQQNVRTGHGVIVLSY